MGFLRRTDLRKLRLANSTWYGLATEQWRTRSERANFKNPSQLIKFNAVFASSSNIPFTRFQFSRKVFWSETYSDEATLDAIQEFGENFGELVKVYHLNAASISDRSDETLKDYWESRIHDKISFLLKHARNLTELKLDLKFELLGMELPSFPSLSKLCVKYHNPDGELSPHDPTFISELLTMAPGIKHCTFGEGKTLSEKLLQNLRLLSENSPLTVVDLSLGLNPHDPPELLQGLLNLPQLKVVGLDLKILHHPPLPDFEFWQVLLDWITLHIENLGKLRFECNERDQLFPFLTLPTFPSLQEFYISIIRGPIFLPFHSDQFPSLKKLELGWSTNTIVKLFSSCVLPSVTEFKATSWSDEIHLFELWSHILPNLKVLKLRGNGVGSAFRLSGLVELTLDYVAFDEYNEVPVEWEWDVYTGGAPPLSRTEIMNLPVAPINEAAGDGGLGLEDGNENRALYLGDLKRKKLEN